MERYLFNNKLCGGSYILEASTNGVTGWTAMIAESNGMFLGRDGLCTAAGQTGITNNQNTSPFVNNIFTITTPSVYNAPTQAQLTSNGSPVFEAGITTTNCQIQISGGSFDANTNTIDDFNIHLVDSNVSTRASVFSSIIASKFNCTLTNYAVVSANIATITFSTLPDVSVLQCKFVVLVRNGKTGETVELLYTGNVNVKPLISPLWTAARYSPDNTIVALSNITVSNTSSSRTPTSETLSYHLYGNSQTFPGNFPSLAYCAIPPGYTRPASFIGYGDWVATTGTVAFSNGGYTNTGEVTSVFIDWLKSTFDVNMFKLSSGTVWNGSNHTSISDIQFRWNNMIQHHNGGAFFSLMYPKLDKMISMRSGSVGPILNIDSSWYYTWGYQRPQKATRIFIARNKAMPYESGYRTYTVPCGHQFFYGVGPDPFTGIGNTNVGTYQYRGTSTLSDIVVSVCNVINYDTGNSIDGWIEVARVNVSIWLRFTIGEFWDTMNDVSNSGGGIWVPFYTSIVQANPNGWKYYRITSNGSGDTKLTTNWTGSDGNNYTTHWYNASTMGSLVTILGGVENTTLKYATVNW